MIFQYCQTLFIIVSSGHIEIVIIEEQVPYQKSEKKTVSAHNEPTIETDKLNNLVRCQYFYQYSFPEAQIMGLQYNI